MKSFSFALFLLLGCALPALSQNVRVDGVVQSTHGPAPNVFIAVCSQPANLSVTPCTTRVALCSSLTDVVCTSPNPVTSDGLGNYFFYIPAGGTYTYQFYGNGLQTRSFVDQQPGSATSTGGVLLNPSGDQTIVGSHQLINRGTGQTGFPFSSFDADIQAFALNPSSGQVAVSGQTSGAGNIGIQGIQTGGGGGSGVFGLGEGLNSATFGGFFANFANVTSGTPYVGTGQFGQINLTVTGTLAEDVGANAGEAKIYGGTVRSLSSYITAGNQDNAGLTGGVATNSYGYNVQQAMNIGTPGATVNAAFHANDQGLGANNYGILLDGATHNWLGQGETQANALGRRDASMYAGATWADKAVTAYSGFCGTITIPDSIAGDGAATTPSVPSCVTLEFPGSATFGFCELDTGKFTKLNLGHVTLQQTLNNCKGIAHLGTTASLQDADHFVINGGVIDCNSKTTSTGITDTPSANAAQDEINSTGVKNCTTVGIQLTGVQFAQINNVTLTGNFVNLKLTSTGGASSNTFTKLIAASPTSGVDVIIKNSATNQLSSGNLFLNPQFQNGTVVAMAVIGNVTLGANSTAVTIVGGSPEVNGGGASSVTIDGDVIPRAGALYQSYSTVDWHNADFEDATATPEISLVNTSNLLLESARGYGTTGQPLVSADAGSHVSLTGRLSAQGVINNVTSYPVNIDTGLVGQGYLWITGAPVLSYTSGIVNSSTVNSMTPSFLNTTGASSSAIATDPFYGQVNTVTFAASAGSKNTNRVIFNGGPTTSGTSDVVISILAKASASTSMQCGADFNNNTSFRPMSFVSGQWTRILLFYGSVANATGVGLTCFANDSVGATISFTGLQILMQPTGTQSSAALTQMLQGAVNPNNGNCSAVGTSASPSVASCADASQGNFSCATAATGATCTVNTSRVTANSQIYVQEDETQGTKLGVTCNTSTTVIPTSRLLASKIANTSFTINLGTVTTNPACFSYRIDN